MCDSLSVNGYVLSFTEIGEHGLTNQLLCIVVTITKRVNQKSWF